MECVKERSSRLTAGPANRPSRSIDRNSSACRVLLGPDGWFRLFSELRRDPIRLISLVSPAFRHRIKLLLKRLRQVKQIRETLSSNFRSIFHLQVRCYARRNGEKPRPSDDAQ